MCLCDKDEGLLVYGSGYFFSSSREMHIYLINFKIRSYLWADFRGRG